MNARLRALDQDAGEQTKVLVEENESLKRRIDTLECELMSQN